ncbi:hypothetical protein [Micromonospora vulcania]|uniref:Sel1 repeat family protein n=1 Tax=Micromonospora vulcania TaxID=1441873 RepID=A0ABW1HDE7_9ACTN
MDIERQLRAALTSKMGPGSDTTTEGQYRAFEAHYRSRITSPDRLRALEDSAVAAEYGVAAYSLGVHLESCGDLAGAERWLRAAAERDIGDAGFRLARLYEGQAVDGFNRLDLGLDENGPAVDERFSEAHYWYRRAASSGYGVPDYPSADGLDTPWISLDCCHSVRALARQEEAERSLVAATRHRDEILRTARQDAGAILGRTRYELRRLSLRHQALSTEVAEFEGTLQMLSRLVNRPRVALSQLIWLVVRSWFSRRTYKSLARIRAVYSLTLAGTQVDEVPCPPEPSLHWRDRLDLLLAARSRSNRVHDRPQRDEPTGDCPADAPTGDITKKPNRDRRRDRKSARELVSP